jgi:hypothetical protein
MEYDIEHIQPYTDEKNSQLVRDDWGDELNKVGNLALFERSLNRKVKNHPDKKQEAYGESEYMSINLLKDKVVGWSKENARSRREMLEDMIKNFILS